MHIVQICNSLVNQHRLIAPGLHCNSPTSLKNKGVNIATIRSTTASIWKDGEILGTGNREHYAGCKRSTGGIDLFKKSFFTTHSKQKRFR
jgi:hypothetical protein